MIKDKKHIAICSTSYYEYDRRLQRIAHSLTTNGYKVTWVSRQKDGDSKKLTFVEHHIIKTDNNRGPSFYKEYNDKINAALIKIKPDIINSVDLDTIIGCCKAQRKLKCSITHDAHEIYYEVPELIGKPIKKSIWKLIAKKHLPTVKTNYTVNHSLKKHYETKYGQTYEVIRNLPSKKQISRTHTASRTNTKRLIYLGVINQGRGIEIAIEAMRKLPDYHLQLVGEGDDYTKLVEVAKGLSNVEFLGFQHPAHLSSILSQASIGLNILQAESLNYRLSLANKFFDYMHAGLPSINMAYPEYQHILKAHRVGVMIDSYDVPALISGIRKLENVNLYTELHSNTASARANYTWEREQQKLLQLYNGLTNL
jgi:glycosyltransferase involved in cell wall biosynthesis